MLTAHERLRLKIAGFRFEPSDCGTPGAFYAIWPQQQEAWAHQYCGAEVELADVDPIIVDEVVFRVIPTNPSLERVWVCATDFDHNLVHFVPELDEDGVAARERLQAFVETLA